MVIVLRNILALIAGVVVGGSVNMSLIVLGPMVIAPPAGVDVTDARSLSANMHLFEARHFVFPFLAHALGTLAGALAAFLIAGSRNSTLAFAVGAVFLAGGVAAAFMIPAPAWFIVVDLALAYLPMAWIGTMIGRRLKGFTAARN
jgi:hypothetical protein